MAKGRKPALLRAMDARQIFCLQRARDIPYLPFEDLSP